MIRPYLALDFAPVRSPTFCFCKIWLPPRFVSTRPKIRSCSSYDSNFQLYWHCWSYDLTLFDPWFNSVQFSFPLCSTHDMTPFEPKFDLFRFKPSFDGLNLRQKRQLLTVPVETRVEYHSPEYTPFCRVRHCLTHNSTLIDPWLNPVRFTFPPYLTHDLTLFEPKFDLVRFKPSFDRLNLRQKRQLLTVPVETRVEYHSPEYTPFCRVRHCLTHNSTLIDPWLNPVRFTFPPYFTHDLTLFEPKFDLVRFKPSFDRLNLRQKDSFWPIRSKQESSTTAQNTHLSAGFDTVWPIIRL